MVTPKPPHTAEPRNIVILYLRCAHCQWSPTVHYLTTHFTDLLKDVSLSKASLLQELNPDTYARSGDCILSAAQALTGNNAVLTFKFFFWRLYARRMVSTPSVFLMSYNWFKMLKSGPNNFAHKCTNFFLNFDF